MSAQTLIVVLYEKTESEKQGKYSVCLSAEHEEHAVPDGAVAEIKPFALLACVGK